MQLYAVRRRNASEDRAKLELAAARSAIVGDEEMPDSIRWIQTYVIEELDGTVRTISIDQPKRIRAVGEHSRRAEIQADEVVLAPATVVIRQQP